MRLSDDDSELYIYTLIRHTDGTHVVYAHSIDATLNRSTVRTPILKDSLELTLPVQPYTLYPTDNIIGLTTGAFDTKVLIFWSSTTYAMYEDTWTPVIASSGVDAVIDMTLPGIAISITANASRVPRDVSFNLVLAGIVPSISGEALTFSTGRKVQIIHDLEGFIFLKSGLQYRCELQSGESIPMINFTITRDIDNADVLTNEVRAVIPVGYYNSIKDATGTLIHIFLVNAGVERRVSSTIISDISDPENKDEITVYSGGTSTVPISETIINVGEQFYERNDNNKKAIRVPPDLNVSYGHILEYGAHKASIIAGRVTTYISKDQSFTEVLAK